MPVCNGCGGPFSWEHIRGKWHAIDPDGSTNHWSWCTAGRKKGKVEGSQLERKGARLRGPNYTPSCGRCDLPPWEYCLCSSRLEKETGAIHGMGEQLDGIRK